MNDEMKKKILVVDDDPVLRELYKNLFIGEGYEVHEAIDGNQAYQKMQSGGYDLILLDIVLPVLDGIEVLQKLKQTPPKIKNGPIIILTNLNTDSTILDSKDYGATDYMIKSDLTPGQVLEKVKKYIG